jgi:site-specific DNA recombinase
MFTGSEKLRCGIYLRISTLDQKEGHGIELQKTRCNAMAILKDWEVVKFYMDEGVSGTTQEAQRPAFSEMLKDIEDGLIQGVIVYALDRIGRRTQIVLRCIENLAEKNVKVISCRENLDTSTATGNFMLTIFAALSQLEHDTIIERMKAGTEERRKKDGDIGGPIPYGYERMPGGGVKIVEEKAEIVRMIFLMRYGDRMYTEEIVSEMNRRGIPSPVKKTEWELFGLRYILHNEAKYCGSYRNASDYRWPKILTKEYYEEEERAQEKFEELKKKKRLLGDPPIDKRAYRIMIRPGKVLEELTYDRQLTEEKRIKRKQKGKEILEREKKQRNTDKLKIEDDKKIEESLLNIPEPKGRPKNINIL